MTPGPPRPSTPRQPSNPRPAPPTTPRPSNPKPVRATVPTGAARRGWRAELAYQFQYAACTAAILAGLELLSIYATGGIR